MDEHSEKINPYRMLGTLHNEGMDYVIGRMVQAEDKTITMEYIVEMVSEYLLTIYKENSKLQSAINFEAISKVLNKYKGLTLEEIFKVSGIALSAETIVYLKQLESMNLGEPDKALERMKEIEALVLNSELPENEQSYPLVFIAIAEASILYMKQSEQGPTKSLWAKFTSKLKMYPWKSDGKGAVAGSLGGAVKGWIAGPAGILVATGLGAVGGAVASSVKDIIFPPVENKRDLEAERKAAGERQKQLREAAIRSARRGTLRRKPGQ